VVASTLTEIRKSRGYTMKAVAEAIGMKPDTYRNYESGRLEPNLTTITKLADFYHVTTDYLLGREEKQPDPLEELAFRYDMSLLEKKIVEAYLGLKKPTREEIRQALRKAADEAATEAERYHASPPPQPTKPEAKPQTLGDDLAEELSRLLSKTRIGN